MWATSERTSTRCATPHPRSLRTTGRPRTSVWSQAGTGTRIASTAPAPEWWCRTTPPSILAGSPISITAHVKFRARPLTGVYILISKGGGRTPSYRVLISSQGRAVCSFRGSLRTGSVHGASTLPTGPGTRSCARKSAGRSRSRWTESGRRRGSASERSRTPRRLSVGAGASGGSKYRGLMDEVNIRVG